MGKFNGGNRFGGDRGGFGGKHKFGGKKFGGGERGERFGGGFDRPQMHDATCSQCGKPCQVPFRPTGDREVFCNDCFRNKKHDKFSKPAFGSKPSFAPRHEQNTAGTEQFKKQLESLNDKLDKVLSLLAVKTEKVVLDATDQDSKAPQKIKKIKPAAKKTKTKKK